MEALSKNFDVKLRFTRTPLTFGKWWKVEFGTQLMLHCTLYLSMCNDTRGRFGMADAIETI